MELQALGNINPHEKSRKQSLDHFEWSDNTPIFFDRQNVDEIRIKFYDNFARDRFDMGEFEVKLTPNDD